MIRKTPDVIAYVAIDTPDLEAALDMAAQIGPVFKGVKIGLEFFAAHGKAGVRAVKESLPADVSLFLDLKLHDIPNTVAGSLNAVKDVSADYITIHAAGGRDMIKAAVEAVEDTSTNILCVTVLTSLTDQDIRVFSEKDVKETALSIAENAVQAGAHGLVCSAHEIAAMREKFGDDIVLMVPGIRQTRDAAHDQKRVMTARQAIEAGASHLVIGRAVTQNQNPKSAAEQILESINQVKAA